MKENTMLADGRAIEAIVALAREGKGEVRFEKLPEAIVPVGAICKQPHVAIITPPNGKPEIIALDSFISGARGKPAQRYGAAKVSTLESFIDLVNRHKAGNSAIFVDANWKQPAFTAVIDYHVKAGAADATAAGEDDLARFGKHRVAYAFPLSEPWKLWVAGNGKAMKQGEFAAFLEDHVHEIASPTAGEEADATRRFRMRCAGANEMLDLARGLEINVDSKVKSKVRLQTGETQIAFETQHVDAGGQEVDVPGLFIVELPLFYRGDSFRVLTRLRYRVDGGALFWTYDMVRPDEIVDGAVRAAVTEAGEKTGLPCYDGAPEA